MRLVSPNPVCWASSSPQSPSTYGAQGKSANGDHTSKSLNWTLTNETKQSLCKTYSILLLCKYIFIMINMFKYRLLGLLRVCDGKFWNDVDQLLAPLPDILPTVFSYWLIFLHSQYHPPQWDFTCILWAPSLQLKTLFTISANWPCGTDLDGKALGRGLFRFRPFQQRNTEPGLPR